MIDQHHVGLVRRRDDPDLVGLAAAYEEARVGAITSTADLGDRDGARGERELLEFQDVFGIGRRAQAQAHKNRPLTRAWSLEHAGISR